MTILRRRLARLARAIGTAWLSLGVAFVALPARAAGSDEHSEAVAALADLRAAIGQIVTADTSYSTDRARYRDSAQRAIDALVGSRDRAYAGHPADGADTTGALGHIDHLLDRRESPPWTDALRGADANLRSAVAKLRRAQAARELMDYEIAVSQALANIEVARGRAGEMGVLGGLEGALATTVLGVPDGAAQVDACAAPQSAPSYGTRGGLLAFIAIPASQGVHLLEHDPGATDVTVQGRFLLLHTAAAAQVARDCAKPQHAAATPAGAPMLFTRAQAIAGRAVFMQKCIACHGANLRGTAAPAVAGTDFLKTAKRNGWTLKIIRYLVVTMMPLNAGGSLSPKEYAELLAFLLASNCYPAGSTPFPVADRPEFNTIQLQPLPGDHPGQDPLGICSL